MRARGREVVGICSQTGVFGVGVDILCFVVVCFWLLCGCVVVSWWLRWFLILEGEREVEKGA